MDYTEVIIKPLLSEKGTALSDQAKPQYVFEVHKKANKHLIAQAIKEKFNVIPEKVRVMNVFGKWKRVRKDYGLTPTVKKALVTLKRGEKIDLFEKK